MSARITLRGARLNRTGVEWTRFRVLVAFISLFTGRGLYHGEIGELYPVFLFRCFDLGLGSADIVAWTRQMVRI